MLSNRLTGFLSSRACLPIRFLLEKNPRYTPTNASIYFPKRDICPVCFTNGDLVDKEISGCGTVYTSSIVQIPSPSGIRPPYACGYVDMALENEDESIRLYALFTDPDPVKIACGQTVELVIDEVRRDDHARAVMAHVFRPVDKD